MTARLVDGVIAVRRTYKRDRDRIRGIRNLLVRCIDLDAVSATQILPNRFEQSSLQNLGHRTNRYPMSLIEFEGSAKGNRRQALGLDALFNLFYHYVCRRPHSDILP